MESVTANCGSPPAFLNGTVNYRNTTEGSEAQYHCDDDFTLEGGMTAVCRADQRWSSTPVCRPLTGSICKARSNEQCIKVVGKFFNASITW